MSDDDMSDHLAAMREESKQRRQRNREHAPTVLQAEGIVVVAHNGGAHLVVAGRVDYWPGTGLWIDRITKTKRRGIRPLVQFVKGLKACG